MALSTCGSTDKALLAGAAVAGTASATAVPVASTAMPKSRAILLRFMRCLPRFELQGSGAGAARAGLPEGETRPESDPT